MIVLTQELSTTQLANTMKNGCSKLSKVGSSWPELLQILRSQWSIYRGAVPETILLGSNNLVLQGYGGSFHHFQ